MRRVRTHGTAIVITAMFMAVASADLAFAETGPEYLYPRAVVPHVGDAPPRFDGVVNDDEYRNFAAISGLVLYNRETIVPKVQQVVWYLGYDDNFLYLSMRSPSPPDIWPAARVKEHDDDGIIYDDHVEIQIAHDRNTARTRGIGNYKIMVNPRGKYIDEWNYNPTPDAERLWTIDGDVKSTVTQESWDLEVKIAIEAINKSKLEGESLVMQLVRADAPGGIYFAGWVGANTVAWHRFGEVVFDSSAPVFRLLDVGDIARGDMDIKIEVSGQTGNSIPVEVKVSVTDGEGKVVHEENSEATAMKGSCEKITLRRDNLPLTAAGNKLRIEAYYPRQTPDGKTGKAVLYNAELPVIYHTEEYWATYIRPWLEGRPDGDIGWNFVCLPSYEIAKVNVDVDFYGIDEAIGNAFAFEVSVTRKDSSSHIAKESGKITDKTGVIILKNLVLPEGDYTAHLGVIGSDGHTVVAKRAVDFFRRHYPWEGNTLGISDRVNPPYTPISVQGINMDVWNRRYTLAPDGLLQRISAGGGAGKEEILRAPMRVAGYKNGHPIQVTDSVSMIKTALAGRVDIAAEGKLGTAVYKVEGVLEYDGWYKVNLTLDPGDVPMELDGLALDIPLWPEADTMYIQRAGDVRRGNKFGAIPEGDGLVWSSRDLPPLPPALRGKWGSFTPIAFVGTGDKGLWWFADDNRSWTMSDDKGAVEVWRARDGVDMRINILAAPTVLKKPRTIEFAFLIDPVKETEDERRWAWAARGGHKFLPEDYPGKAYAHSTPGWRIWGRGANDFTTEQHDREALRAVLTDRDWVSRDPKPWVQAKAFRSRFYHAVGERNLTLTLYGSTFSFGLAMPELDTYGGEWLGASNWVPRPHARFRGRMNWQGTYSWDADRDVSVSKDIAHENFTRSFEDAFVWHHCQLLRDVPVNGTWWDNLSIRVTNDYDPDTGEFYQRWNVFDRRRLMKRLYNIGYELGRTPWWISNMHVDWSFNAVAWHIENDFHIWDTGTLMDVLSVDEFRAMARVKRGIIHRLHVGPHQPPETTDKQRRLAARSVPGMALLHDIGSYMHIDEEIAPEMIGILDEKVGFFDDAEFLPYWRNGDLVSIDTPGVYVSAYRGGNRKAALVVVNTRREDLDVNYKLDPRLINRDRIETIYDGETGSRFKTPRGEEREGAFILPASSVRLLVVE